MVEILAIENRDDEDFDLEKRLLDLANIMIICSSLINYNDEESNSENPNNDDSNNNDSNDNNITRDLTIQIRLAYFFVKKYLLFDRCPLRLDFQMLTCHMAMAKGCLLYLLYLYKNLPLIKDLVN